MSKARYLIEKLGKILEDDMNGYNNDEYSGISPEDTIIHNLKSGQNGNKWQCPTCGQDLDTGVMSPSLIECPKCMQTLEVHRADGPFRTTSGNTRRANGMRAYID